jgi:hypothetical protein
MLHIVSLLNRLHKKKGEKKPPWHKSASKLYRLSDRRLSETLVPTFADRGLPRGQHDGSLQLYSQNNKLKELYTII